MKTGIDRIDEFLYLFEGKRVGLITNPTGMDGNLRSTIDVLKEKVDLVALFAPEHGIRGDLQAGVHLESPLTSARKSSSTAFTRRRKNRPRK